MQTLRGGVLTFAVSAIVIAAGHAADGPVTMAEIDALCQAGPRDAAKLKEKGVNVDALDWLCALPENGWAVAGSKHLKDARAAVVRKGIAEGYRREGIATRRMAPAAAALKGASFETALLWGLTDFLIKRAEAEADAWLLDQLRDQLCGEQAKYKGLMPNACMILGGPALPELFGGFTALRAAVRKDLHALPGGLATLHAAGVCDVVAADGDECDGAVILSLAGSLTGVVVEGGRTPILALLDMATPARRDRWASASLSAERTPAADAVVKVLLLLQAVVTVDEKGKLTLENMSSADNRRHALLAGLVNVIELKQTQPDPKWWFDLEKRPEAALPLPVHVLKTDPTLKELQDAVGKIDDAVEAWRTVKNNASAPKEQLVAASALVLQALAGSLEAALSTAEVTPKPVVAATIRTVHQHAGALVAHILTPDYGALLIEVLSVADELGWDKGHLPQGVGRVLSFVVDVGQAQDASQVETAIGRLAAPVGSYKKKRAEGKTALNVNAYLGVFGPWERATTTGSAAPAAASSPWKPRSMSPWVPIGIEGAAGTSSGSWGLFVHFMDVGALASYRFSTDGAEQEGSADGDVPVEPTPTVSLKQVFSPGLFLTHGFKKAPLSIAIGASFSPELRTVADVGDAQGNPKRAKAWRWGVALAMDLPLFP